MFHTATRLRFRISASIRHRSHIPSLFVVIRDSLVLGLFDLGTAL